MRCAGLVDAPRAVIEEYSEIKRGDVVLPAQMAEARRRTIHLRCLAMPDEAPKALLDRLGLPLLRRLWRIDEFAPTKSRSLCVIGSRAIARTVQTPQLFNLG